MKKFCYKRCEIISEFSNKLYFKYEKSREDLSITLEEMVQFNKLLSEYRTAVIQQIETLLVIRRASAFQDAVPTVSAQVAPASQYG